MTDLSEIAIEGLNIMPLSSCEFCGNLCCENHTVLKGVNEILPIFSIIFIQFGGGGGELVQVLHTKTSCIQVS